MMPWLSGIKSLDEGSTVMEQAMFNFEGLG